jgi:UDP-glucose 4-epimerase
MPKVKAADGWRAVVTGGAGFIGSALTEQLVQAGASVQVVDDLRTGDESNLARVIGRIDFVKATLAPNNLDPLTQGADVIFHCAASAYVPPSVDQPLADFEINLHLPLALLEWCRLKSPGTRLILFSSGAVYGNPQRLPVRETDPLAPISPYGVSKLAAERYGAVYASLFDMRVASLRCFAVYGPRQRKQVVYDLMRKMVQGKGSLEVLGDGTQIRDLCFVDDVARAAMAVARRGPLGGEALNVGTGNGVKLAKLVDLTGRALGLVPKPHYTGSIRPGDPEAVVADWSRLGSLGWRPEVDIEDGIHQTARWFTDQEGRVTSGSLAESQTTANVP